MANDKPEYVEHSQTERISALLLGRKVTKVNDHIVQLDNGMVLEFPNTDGGCACSAGCYDVTALNSVDNVITNVEFDYSPGVDYGDGEGHYKIFVFCGDDRINLVTYEGDDGSGYYGTGFTLYVTVPEQQAAA